jgi:hypothetical protein
MPLSKEDLEAIGNVFDTKIKALEDRFSASLKKLGKRVQRLETGFADMARVARRKVVSCAKDRHDGLLRSMFNESTLVAVPPLQEDQHGKFSRPAAACNIDDVKTKLTNLLAGEVKFEVEPTFVGYRILMANFSSHSRRKSAATVIAAARKELKDSLGLLLQYDKPHELRILQREAHKFLSVLQKRSNGVVQAKQLKDGFLVINGVRFAPEYLVPGPSYWDGLADEVVKKIRQWRGRPPTSPATGLMTDYFGALYAEEQGIVELDVEEGEDDFMDVGNDLFT